jgi:hypothetical protein
MPIKFMFDKQIGTKSGSKRCHRVLAVGALAAVALPISGGVAGAAIPRPNADQTLNFFSKAESMVFLTTAGKPFIPSQSNPPKPGDEIEGTDLDYVGSHSDHAKNWTASDHQLCIFNSAGNPVCHAQVAIGGSMILAQATLTNISANSTTSTFEVTGGTGLFQGVSGVILVVNLTSAVGSNSDVTITLNRK